MKTALQNEVSAKLHEVVDTATKQIRQSLTDRFQLEVDIFEFTGSQLRGTQTGYSPLDLLQVGLSEKANRDIHFLLIIVESDLITSSRTHRLFLISKLTNIGILSTKRLNPKFWGNSDDTAVTCQRLTALMLHTLGHILELDYESNAENMMYHLQSVDELDTMHHITNDQIERMNEMIPLEAHEEVSKGHNIGFVIKHILGNIRIIGETVTEANPFGLSLSLSTVMTTAFSVMIVLFFTAEIWDVAGALHFAPLIIFSVIALASSTGVYYSAFKVGSNHRQNRLGESRVIIIASTLITLLLVNLLLYAIFFGVSLITALLMFPDELKQTWATVYPANTIISQIRLGMFLATMGVLTGSLGGRADSEVIIYSVLFSDRGI